MKPISRDTLAYNATANIRSRVAAATNIAGAASVLGDFGYADSDISVLEARQLAVTLWGYLWQSLREDVK